jgi:hypothetical protein
MKEDTDCKEAFLASEIPFVFRYIKSIFIYAHKKNIASQMLN